MPSRHDDYLLKEGEIMHSHSADDLPATLNAATAGDGIDITDGVVSNTDRGSSAVTTHNATFDHNNLHAPHSDDQDLSGYSLITHNHALNNLSEKSYNSLTDKPTIPTQYTDAMAVSAVGTPWTSAGYLTEETDPVWNSEKSSYSTKAQADLLYAPISVVNYTLPTASASVLGGIKVGSRLSISDGVLSADVQTTDISGKEDVGVAAGLISTHESTYNHANFATAYGWGNHAGLYLPIATVIPSNEAGSANNFLTAYNSTTGAFSKARPTWANIDKTTSDIADITTRSHTALTDIGTNTHAQIDTFIGTTVPNTYAPLTSANLTTPDINVATGESLALSQSTTSAQLTVTNTNASAAGARGAGAIFAENDGAALASGDRLGFFLFAGSSSASSVRNTGGLAAYASENWTDGSAYGTKVSIESVANGATGRTETAYFNGTQAYFVGDVSALSFTDRTPYFDGDALSAIKGIKGSKGDIDHTSLPKFARKKIKVKKNKYNDKGEVIGFDEYEEEGRDLGAMISILIKAVQELTMRVEKIEGQV